MAGGGAANWTGSCDEQPVSIGPSGYAAAKYLFGLDAHPDGAAKSQAVNAAKVIITGNHSNIHGGGIMTNGGLILGDPGGKVVTATPELDITGTKALLKDGVKQNEGLNFQFKLTDSEGGRKSERQHPMLLPDNFRFRPTCSISQTGTHTYTLSEVKGDQAGVTYDTNVHTIQVTDCGENRFPFWVWTFKSYYVSSVTLDGSESGGSSGSGSGTGSETGTFRFTLRTRKAGSTCTCTFGDSKIR